jgi:hypothetical protein
MTKKPFFIIPAIVILHSVAHVALLWPVPLGSAGLQRCVAPPPYPSFAVFLAKKLKAKKRLRQGDCDGSSRTNRRCER